LDRRNAELGRLLQHEIHPVAGADALREVYRQRRLAVDDAPLAHGGHDAALAQLGERRARFGAVSVEQHDRVALMQPQRRDVAGDALG
jgi:prephenate dehydrogenase